MFVSCIRHSRGPDIIETILARVERVNSFAGNCNSRCGLPSNEGRTQSQSSFVTTVDEVERLTGLYFFVGLADEDEQESDADYSGWRN